MNAAAVRTWGVMVGPPPKESTLHGPSASGHRGALSAWFVVITATFAFTSTGSISIAGFGWVGVAFCVWIYFRSGGLKLDAVSVWALSGLLFVGIGAVLLPSDRIASPTIAALAVYLALVLLTVTTAIAWWPRRSQPVERPRSPRTLPAGELLKLGVLSYALGLGMSSIDLLASLADGFLQVGLLLASLGAASQVRRSPLTLVVPALLLTVHLATWSGGGRLTILALIISALMVFQYRSPPRTLFAKAAIIPLLVPALFVAALVESNRSNPQSQLLTMPNGFDASQSLYSVWSPLYVFISLMESEMEGILQHHGLHTFLAAATSLVPRGIWAAKPDGWGRDLAWVFNPVAAESSNHSEAGLVPAEFLWGFGLVGILVGIPLTGLLLRYIDLGLQQSRARAASPGRGAPALVGWVVLSTSLFSLFWAGSFTFATRAAVQLFALMIMTWIGRTLDPGASRQGPAWTGHPTPIPTEQNYNVRRPRPDDWYAQARSERLPGWESMG